MRSVAGRSPGFHFHDNNIMTINTFPCDDTQWLIVILKMITVAGAALALQVSAPISRHLLHRGGECSMKQ